MGNCCTTELHIPIKWFHDFEKTLPDLTGKRIAITGTTSGMGQVAALVCARRGAEIFMLNRQSERAEKMLKRVREEVPAAADRVRQIACDMQDFASVRQAAAELLELCRDQGLDILCNNAGVMRNPDQATKDGYDIQMQTNHLSHFLLTKELFPVLRRAADLRGEARIVSHSSVARNGSALNSKFFQKNGGRMGSTATERYHQTKLANAVFTYALADKLAAAGIRNIKAVCCAPGTAVTNLFQEISPTAVRCGSCIMACFVQSPEDATMPLLSCMAKTETMSGDFFVPDRCAEIKGPPRLLPRPATGNMVDRAGHEMLWAESEKAVGEKFTIAS